MKRALSLRLAALLIAPAVIAGPVEESYFSLELMDAGDVSLAQASGVADVPLGEWDASISLALGSYDIDYVPVSFDFLGSSTKRSESTQALQINGQRPLGETKTLLLGAGAYKGFTNFRSIWLDEYYRQQFSQATDTRGFENYIDSSPGGYSFNTGLRWMYLPATAFAQITVSRIQDTVAPGYEIDFDGLRRGQVELATTALTVSTENVLTPRLRALLTLRASETSGREMRLGAEYALNAAIADDWIFRIAAGAATEDPDFDAYYGNLAIEYAASENLSLYSDARYYKDTGEVEDAFLFTSAAPGALSRKAGIGLRYSGENWLARLYYARSSTRYEPSESSLIFFGNLYQARDWDIIQLAFSKTY